MTSEGGRYRLGFDIGGTFTDFVLIDEHTGTMYVNKCLTTPDQPNEAVIQGLEQLMGRLGITAGDIQVAIHGTTLITNAIIERKGALAAMVTTSGFRDVLEMGTEVRYDIYDLFLERPEPLVPRNLRFEVRERLDQDGRVVTPLNDADMQALLEQLDREAVEAVGIVFLHSFRNPAHELIVRDAILERFPEMAVCVSCETCPEIREYERMSTTVANAYVKPITGKYVARLQEGLVGLGYGRELFFMLSSGGITDADTARDHPIRLVESGPAAGVLAAATYGRLAGLESVISFDIGGTTAKIGVVSEGQASRSSVMEMARVSRFKKGSGIPVKIPVIELIEIGAGGGSIAHVDRMGLLKVGPESAGASPGPACYGFGGIGATVTDADLVLGYLNPEYFLGGDISLDEEAARGALDRLGQSLGMDLQQAAIGVFNVVNENMVSAMKVHIAEQGEDPRRFCLVAFGGAGPVHAYEIARMLNIPELLVPLGAGATSAFGFLATPVSFEFARSYYTALQRVDPATFRNLFRTMADEGLTILKRAGITVDGDNVSYEYAADMRHRGQGHELTVRLSPDLVEEADMTVLKRTFHEEYVRKYGHSHDHLDVEMITCRLVVTGPVPAISLAGSGPEDGDTVETACIGSRSVYFPEEGGFTDTPVYRRHLLRPGNEFPGPAVVEERESTCVVGPGGRVRVDGQFNLRVQIQRGVGR